MSGSHGRWAFVVIGVLVLFGAASTLDAQADLGFRVGGVFADLDSETAGFESDTRAAVGGGVYLTYWLNDYVAVQPELNYMPKGAELGSEGVDAIGAELEIDYLVLPLLLRVSAPPSNVAPFVYGGPALGIETSCSFSAESVQGDVNLDCAVVQPLGDLDGFDRKSVEVGAIVGAGIAVPLGAGTVVLEGRLDLGLTDILDSGVLDAPTGATTEAELLNRSTSLFLGLLIPLGLR